MTNQQIRDEAKLKEANENLVKAIRVANQDNPL